MKNQGHLNVLFFKSNTLQKEELDEYYDLSNFHKILIEYCDYCGDERLNIQHLQNIYKLYVDVFISQKYHFKEYFLNLIEQNGHKNKRCYVIPYMIFGDLWKKTKGNNSIVHYLNRGFKYDAAVELLRKRQNTVSAESFKERYGDDWKFHFDEYISKKKNTLLSNPNINQINHSKGKSTRYEYYLDKINPNTNKLYTEEEAKEELSKRQRCSSMFISQKRRGKSGVTCRSVQYWINKGFSEEEAKTKVKEIQSTNNIDTYIKKYGEQEGIKKWMSRNKKWGEKMQEKRVESGHIGCAYSQASKIFFNKLVESLKLNGYLFDKIYYGENEFSKWDKENKRPYFYDFVIPEIKLCIEYNGIKFHPREGDESWVGLFGDSYEYKLNYDKQKIKVIEDCGFDVIIVWEDENLDEKIEDILLHIKK